MSTAIALRGIRKTYGKTTALDGLELEVAEGEFFCLLGPSGAGKTTTLKTIAGLEQPDAGTVELDGKDMRGVEPYDRGVAMCFESYALYPHKSAYDNLASPLRSPAIASPPTGPGSGSARPPNSSASQPCWTARSGSCPTVSGSAWPSAASWSARPAPSSSTSPSPTWTPSCASRCAPS